MIFNIITIFPEIFDSYFSQSIIRRAQEKGIIKINIYNLRKWTKDKHKTVDDKPYGGGPGMIMLVKPIYQAIEYIKSKSKSVSKSNKLKTKTKTILLSAKGKQWNQKMAQEYSKLNNIILICGRYEGVDARVENFVDEKISVGNYILTGGEIPAMILVDSITRLVPNVIKPRSLLEESFSFKENELLQEYPQYSKPKVFSAKGKKYSVPKVLLSGNHKEIKQWREKNKKK